MIQQDLLNPVAQLQTMCNDKNVFSFSDPSEVCPYQAVWMKIQAII